MAQTVRTILGSKDFLVTFIRHHTDRTLTLLQPGSPTADYQLVDASDKNGIFAMPLIYRVLHQYDGAGISGMVHFMYFNLSADDTKVFFATANKVLGNCANIYGLNQTYLMQKQDARIQFVVVTCWDNDADFYDWKQSKEFAPLADFVARSADTQGYHETTYRIVSPSEYDQPAPEEA
ncbi:hypothetical protein IV38_GL001435 [Lactobacillus selangorensis]|uniref:ABM domain-containing protein n=1 Tax=Lactobacillus selangorensis TaxID=81857 RepID=A0A0R2FIJ5_9LACO|nr:hypothetical protein [Lactobacillus selangorensis]KRN28435.1 hypothetical protein IV38_GL001435 [Lactobacillus selangorensis]KRN31936.1 hypothetical protein IV40_GL001222 [Lactobacillus selangorensis]